MSITYPQFPATSFPDSMQDIISFLDVTQNDSILLNQFKTNYLQGRYQQANSYLRQIPNYSQKILTSAVLNNISDTIQALELFYGTNISSIIATKQTEWLNILNQFSFKGVWSSTASYVKNNMVSYFDQFTGATMLYLLTGIATVGRNPLADPTNWKQLTIQGIQGDSGTTGVFAFNWDAQQQYSVNTIVVYGNKWWQAKQENTNHVPQEDETWHLVLDFSPANYPVQDNQPIGQTYGDIWFQTGV